MANINKSESDMTIKLKFDPNKETTTMNIDTITDTYKIDIKKTEYGFSYNFGDGPVGVNITSKKDFIGNINKILNENVGKKDFSKEIEEIYNKMFTQMKKIPKKINPMEKVIQKTRLLNIGDTITAGTAGFNKHYFRLKRNPTSGVHYIDVKYENYQHKGFEIDYNYKNKSYTISPAKLEERREGVIIIDPKKEKNMVFYLDDNSTINLKYKGKKGDKYEFEINNDRSRINNEKIKWDIIPYKGNMKNCKGYQMTKTEYKDGEVKEINISFIPLLNTQDVDGNLNEFNKNLKNKTIRIFNEEYKIEYKPTEEEKEVNSNMFFDGNFILTSVQNPENVIDIKRRRRTNESNAIINGEKYYVRGKFGGADSGLWWEGIELVKKE